MFFKGWAKFIVLRDDPLIAFGISDDIALLDFIMLDTEKL
jgi:hypothetical protein